MKFCLKFSLWFDKVFLKFNNIGSIKILLVRNDNREIYYKKPDWGIRDNEKPEGVGVSA